MPANANVIIEYGPYKSNGIVDFREDRLIGMKKYLEKMGHNLKEMRKVENWNWISVIVNDEQVFKCNINDLEFAGDGELDPLVKNAELAIKNAY